MPLGNVGFEGVDRDCQNGDEQGPPGGESVMKVSLLGLTRLICVGKKIIIALCHPRGFGDEGEEEETKVN